jgi:pimeloyl-ACP methyl ester carboxylesterase
MTALLMPVLLLVGGCATVAGEAAPAIRRARASATTTTTTTTTAPASTSAASTQSSGAGFVPEPVAWEKCGSRLECATVVVPLDYDDPSGATIHLAINRRPARRPDERIGALLMNPGGPGASGLSLVANGGSLPSDVLDRFDIVGFDPRGVGQSTQLTCGDDTVPPFRRVDSAPDSPDEQAALDAAAKAVADDCRDNDADLLPHLGTDDVVRDMNTIRQAIGENQISYLGLSYGTLLGLRYATLFPQQTRAIVLDGVVDPAQDLREFLRRQTIAFEKQIGAIFDACPDGGGGCPPGGAAAAYDEVARRVETAPIDGSNGQSLGPSELAIASLIPTYEPTTVPVFYDALARALDGDGSEMLRLTDAYERSVKYTIYAAVECIDSPHPVGAAEYQSFAAELEALSPRFGGAIANELLPCAFWPAPVRNIIGPVTAPGAPPILVIGSTGDAATPFEQAERVASTLENGRLLTFDGPGHTTLGHRDCAAAAEAAYFIDLTLPPEGTVCSN